MRADAKRRQLDIEQQVATDWLAAQMHTMAAGGKLDPLDDWLKRVRPQPRRTAADWLRTLRDAAGRGAKMTIRKVEG